MNNQSAEDYLDKLLNSVNGETFDEEPDIEGVDIEKTNIDESNMVTKRVSKSEADFLSEFEKELEGDDFSDFMKSFDEDTAQFSDPSLELDDINLKKVDDLFGSDLFMDELEPKMQTETEVMSELEMIAESEMTAESEMIAESEMESEPETIESFFDKSEAVKAEPTTVEDFFGESTTGGDVEDSFTLGGIDLGGLLDEASGGAFEESTGNDEPSVELDVMSEATPEPISDDDMFANLFGDVDETGELGASGGGIDLGNLGEADLMSLLSGGDLGDIGDMLSQEESGAIPMDTDDAFASFAEGEMASHGEESTPVEKKQKSKAKKGGLLDKLSTILFGLDDEEEAVSLSAKKAPSAGDLSDENASILASMDEEEKGKKKDKKAKKEKKKKEPKEKKEKKPKKEKKEKKPKKEKKEKKEKKPVEIDKTPPLKKGPVILVCLMVASLFALVMLGTNLAGYASAVATATSYSNNGEYALAYKELLGLELKEDDMALYNQVATLATVDSELNSYEIFYENGRYEEALDSLICAAGRCKLNEANAEVYECQGQMETLKKEVTNELKEKYGLTYGDAIDLYELDDRDDYTIELKRLIKELGLE